MALPDWDLVVVGAGIHGAGVAQAAALSGMRVALLEKTAVAAGTSSRSSKLIHGGLRYLESRQFSLVRESLREREILLSIAPHLVRRVPFLIPVYRSMQRGPWLIRAGLTTYAALLGFRKQARFRRWPRSEWERLKGLRLDGLLQVFEYSDAQTDDAMLCRAVVQSACDHGAELLCPADLLEARVEQDVVTARVLQGSHEQQLTTRVLVNAAGPWVDQVRRRIHPAPPEVAIELVAGTHLELEGCTEPGVYYTEHPADQRAVFIMPWKGHTLVGTTERVHQQSPDRITPTDDELNYLRQNVRHHFPDHSLQQLGSFAGLRVLPAGKDKAFGKPREVILQTDDSKRPRVLTIYGGKLTGYRATAQRVLQVLSTALPSTPLADTSTLRLPAIEQTQDAAR